MKNTLRMDFYRVGSSPYIYLCTLGIFILHFANAIGDSISAMTLDFKGVIFYLDGGFSVVDWVLCVIGGGIGFCDEVKNGYLKYNVVRNKQSTYCISKIITAGISGFICSFMGLELFHGGYLLLCMGGQKNLSLTYSALLDTHAMIFGMSLLCSVLSMLGLIFALIIQDAFVSMAIPVLFLYIYAYACTILKFPHCIHPTFVFFYAGLYGRIYSVFLVICIGILCYFIMNRKITRRLQHG